MNKKMFGYMGQILLVDLSAGTTSTVSTEKYREWGGGHGLGSALFWDYCTDKSITDGRDPKNVVVVASSPFSGTNVPSAGGRCEVVGVGMGQYPINWFTRSNFGGRFSATMKYAGWDAIVLMGKAKKPVWLDIRNNEVTIRSADKIWGKDTKVTQQMLWKQLLKEAGGMEGWYELPGKKGPEYSTQKPAVLCIGPAGENQVGQGCLVHDSGNGAGQCGLGAVWGSKNLKAISLQGTCQVEIADPAALVQARFDAKEYYAADDDDPDQRHWGAFGNPAKPIIFCQQPTDKRRTQSCQGCINGCRARFNVGYGNEVSCQETAWYAKFAIKWAKGDKLKASEIIFKAGDLCNQLGVNSYPLSSAMHWFEHLFHEGIMGPGKKIDSQLDWEKIGSVEFAEQFLLAIAEKRDIGALIADGYVQGAIAAGREEDWRNGTLLFPYWGMPEHGYDARVELEWGFETIMCDRDMNSHCLNWIFWYANIYITKGVRPRISAEKIAKLVTDKMKPWVSGPEALDYSNENMYSDEVMQLVRWHMYYTRYWKNSTLLCDFRWADLFNTNSEDWTGATGSEKAGEQVFWNAVTGEDISFNDGIERGRRIWHLDNAIWALQGRHRDIVHYADYIYDKDCDEGEILPYFYWPCRDENGNWRYQDIMHRRIDREKFEDWKTRFYGQEGCAPDTGWPTRATLEGFGLKQVADELEKNKRLGREDKA